MSLLCCGWRKTYSDLCYVNAGFGNNAVEMQTRADFDGAADEWVITTPTTLAQKWVLTLALPGCRLLHYAPALHPLIVAYSQQRASVARLPSGRFSIESVIIYMEAALNLVNCDVS